MQGIAILLGVVVIILAGILWELRGIRVGEKSETAAQRFLTVGVAVAALIVAVVTAVRIVKG